MVPLVPSEPRRQLREICRRRGLAAHLCQDATRARNPHTRDLGETERTRFGGRPHIQSAHRLGVSRAKSYPYQEAPVVQGSSLSASCSKWRRSVMQIGSSRRQEYRRPCKVAPARMMEVDSPRELVSEAVPTPAQGEGSPQIAAQCPIAVESNVARRIEARALAYVRTNLVVDLEYHRIQHLSRTASRQQLPSKGHSVLFHTAGRERFPEQ